MFFILTPCYQNCIATRLTVPQFFFTIVAPLGAKSWQKTRLPLSKSRRDDIFRFKLKYGYYL